MALRLSWLLIFLTFVSVMLYLASPLLAVFATGEYPLQVKTVRLEDLPQGKDAVVQFPTVTLCAVQHSDRWNLPRIMLNQVAFYYQDLFYSPEKRYSKSKGDVGLAQTLRLDLSRSSF